MVGQLEGFVERRKQLLPLVDSHVEERVRLYCHLLAAARLHCHTALFQQKCLLLLLFVALYYCESAAFCKREALVPATLHHVVLFVGSSLPF